MLIPTRRLVTDYYDNKKVAEFEYEESPSFRDQYNSKPIKVDFTQNSQWEESSRRGGPRITKVQKPVGEKYPYAYQRPVFEPDFEFDIKPIKEENFEDNFYKVRNYEEPTKNIVKQQRPDVYNTEKSSNNNNIKSNYVNLDEGT